MMLQKRTNNEGWNTYAKNNYTGARRSGILKAIN